MVHEGIKLSKDVLESAPLTELRRFVMKFSSRTVLFFFALTVLAGCASTNVTQQTPTSNPGLARPNRIWVYNFIANTAGIARRFLYQGRGQRAQHATDG